MLKLCSRAYLQVIQCNLKQNCVIMDALFVTACKIALFYDIAQNTTAEQEHKINPARQGQVSDGSVQCANITAIGQTRANAH